MKKNNKKILAIMCSLFITTTLCSSCSAFFGDDGYVITSTSQSSDENGNIVLTLNFSGDQKPMNITVPKGLSGKDGVGIKSIKPVVEEDNISITIEYTDSSIEPTIFKYPIINGKDGKGIKDCMIGLDELGNTTIQFTYTDGTVSDVISIPKGETGNGISHISLLDYNSETKTSTYLIKFTNGSETTFTVRDGQDGLSIMNIEYDEENSTDTQYALNINYSDGSVQQLFFDKPIANTRHHGTTDNVDFTMGINGDFYLNIVNGNVYLKVNGFWQLQFCIKGNNSGQSTEAANVLFWYEDESNKTQVIPAAVIKYSTLSIDKIPVLESTKDKTFIGWYSTKQNDKFAINAGKFTNLTVVAHDTVNVYAWWK